MELFSIISVVAITLIILMFFVVCVLLRKLAKRIENAETKRLLLQTSTFGLVAGSIGVLVEILVLIFPTLFWMLILLVIAAAVAFVLIGLRAAHII